MGYGQNRGWGGRGISLRATVCGLAAITALVSTVARGSAWFYPEAMFYHDTQPGDPLAYNLGRLGIVLPTYDPRYLIVAYRWMKGLPLDREAAQRLLPLPADVDARNNVQQAITAWLAVRRKVIAGPSPAINPEKENSEAHEYVLNCTADAFRNAAQTLSDRLRAHPNDHAGLREWVTGQDTVFANCSGNGPLPARLPKTAPAWLAQDRAYQIAAAHFYRGEYADARMDFTAIARDSQSPWRSLAAYLAVRSQVQAALVELDAGENATQTHPYGYFQRPENPPYISPAAQQAYTAARVALRHLLADPHLVMWHQAARGLGGRLESRFHPEARLAVLQQAILAPHVPDDLWQDVRDFTLLTYAGQGLDLSRWLAGARNVRWGWQRHPEGDVEDARQRWLATHSLPWLWLALVGAAEGNRPAPDLWAAAAKVPSSSPAYVAIQYYRLAGLRQAGHMKEAREVADTLLARHDLDRSARNLILMQRAGTQTSLAKFIQDGVRPIIAVTQPGSEMGFWVTPQDIRKSRFLNWRPELRQSTPSYFSPEAARIMNQAMPYQMLYDVLDLPMPANDQQMIALAAWTRGYLLGDLKTPVRLIPYLAPINKDIAAMLARYRNSRDPAERRFVASVVLLSLPSATPIIIEGMGREDPPDAIGLVGQRFWTPRELVHHLTGCFPALKTPVLTDAQQYCDLSGPATDPALAPPFLKGRPYQQARVEARRMMQAGSATVIAGKVIMAWTHRHPDDPLAPRALHLVVRAGHFIDAEDCVSDSIVVAAFKRLHSVYPTSEWARRTKYWYADESGPVPNRQSAALCR